MNLTGWLNLIWYLNIAATALLLVQLVAQRLQRSYPLLVAYFLLDLAQEIVGLWVIPNSRPYFYTYLGGQALKLILAVLVVLDLTRLALAGHPALAKFGRSAAGYVMLLLAAVASVGLYFGPPVAPQRSPALHYFLSFEHSMDSILAAYLILISLFMLWFPVAIRRNAALYIGGFVAYFLNRGAALLAMNTWPTRTPAINVAELSVSLACLSAWVLLLRREGETTEVITGHRWNPDAMDRLRAQLNTINTRLMRIQ